MAIANMKNKTASTMVTRCRTKSSPRAFCFPKSCSAPPEMAPERPALVPDCNNTTTINAKCYDYKQCHQQSMHFVPPPDIELHNKYYFTK